MQPRFAASMSCIRPSFVSSILGAAGNPNIISFAGGFPATELFPVEDLRLAAEEVFRSQGASALQYGPSVGYQPLREWLAEEMGRRGAPCSADNIVLTSGAQQGLDLAARAFLEPGDAVLVESPTYLTVIRVLQAVQARLVAAPTDEHGIVTDGLEELIQRERPRLLYTITNFQNPMGVTLTEARRRRIAELASRYGFIVIEDDPYGQLRYAGTPVKPLKAFDQSGHVIYAGTLSKIVAPGMRVGWSVIDGSMLEAFITWKQVVDTMSSSLDQRIAHAYLQTGKNPAQVEKIRATYQQRFEAMAGALERYMPEGFSWTRPEGGMFLWVTGPRGLDTSAMVQAASQRGVLYVPGEDFFPLGEEKNSLRLSFSTSSPQRIEEGVRILADVCRQQPLSS